MQDDIEECNMFAFYLHWCSFIVPLQQRLWANIECGVVFFNTTQNTIRISIRVVIIFAMSTYASKYKAENIFTQVVRNINLSHYYKTVQF